MIAVYVENTPHSVMIDTYDKWLRDFIHHSGVMSKTDKHMYHVRYPQNVFSDAKHTAWSIWDPLNMR